MPVVGAVPLRNRDPETWAALRKGGLPRRVERGSVLLHEGDASDYVVLIEDGSLKVVAIAENGTEVVLAVRRSGDIVGDFAAVESRPRSASLVALQRSTVVIVTATTLRATLRQRPEAAMSLLRSTVWRINEGDRRRIECSSYEVPERIRRVLVELVEMFRPEGQDDAVPVLIPLIQQDLASLSAASRESTARVLRRLRERGIVQTARSRILVVRPDLLDGVEPARR
jgi:CRP-like cAMP-binding protein